MIVLSSKVKGLEDLGGEERCRLKLGSSVFRRLGSVVPKFGVSYVSEAKPKPPIVTSS